MRFRNAKELTADRFVAALGQPPAALVPASEVDGEGHSGKTVYDSVI